MSWRIEHDSMGEVRVPAENRTVRTVRGSTAFRAESADMEKEVEIPFDASSLAGRTVVVYERLYEVTEEGRKGRLAASHEEIDSPEQTVRISEPPAEPEPTPAPAVTPEPGTDKKTPAKPSVRTASPGMIRAGSARTGDSSHAVRWLLLLAAAVSVSGLLLRKRFRKEA